MHEASLCQGLLELVLKTVSENNERADAKKITRIQEIVCELGLYSCIEPQTFASCFELFAENTIAEGAKLTIQKAPLQCDCLQCGHAFTVNARQFHCPQCGSDNIHFDGGHGLMLLNLRVDTEE